MTSGYKITVYADIVPHLENPELGFMFTLMDALWKTKTHCVSISRANGWHWEDIPNLEAQGEEVKEC